MVNLNAGGNILNLCHSSCLTEQSGFTVETKACLACLLLDFLEASTEAALAIESIVIAVILASEGDELTRATHMSTF
ncbi:hypothetical protein Gasu2_21190 [Galdieria sulphuraria]|nr:hypothetical protein Gasu2_21190 [Galdieria sulphuraria]